eukprot:TRINITY_DN18380_c0_g1_i1.p1 TRINITY_DN18380_c0_g1~~TRINITY_DN18380_c0_g1_i1.p1  ORF type:complete len:409 (+),score=162.53 TRINITY_DN18380_c0_g1_i1:129-1355(+)
MSQSTSFPKTKIKILLLENVDQVAVQAFRNEGFQVEEIKHALTEEEFKVKVKGVHAVGIRSKSKLTEAVLAEANRLLCIAAFCIGTDQIDLKAAEKHGVPVFNSPFSNSRSVAELMICEILTLSRKLGDQIQGMHNGHWTKSAKDCHEIRGKTLGIVGYGHIGSQLSVLAESMGMHVIFYDIINQLPLGNSKQMPTLEAVLTKADFVTLHVPKTEQTHMMIGARQLSLMKKGSYLLNASRGTVVDLVALKHALTTGHLLGAAIDVYPTEPEANCKDWTCDLQGLPNVILTPHIGGSTEEAQLAIGREVSEKMIKFINAGCTTGSVNFPALELPVSSPVSHRILNIHHNVPGVLKSINGILGEINVSGQILRTSDSIGYLVVDVEKEASAEVQRSISELPSSIKTRILF